MSEEKQRQGASSNERRENQCSNVRIGLRVLAAAGAISSGAIIILDSVRQCAQRRAVGCSNGQLTPGGGTFCP
jgi:hypothetical protein